MQQGGYISASCNQDVVLSPFLGSGKSTQVIRTAAVFLKIVYLSLFGYKKSLEFFFLNYVKSFMNFLRIIHLSLSTVRKD